MTILKNNYFKFILFFVIFVFLFLTLGEELCHNHSDVDFHRDCPACNWQNISIVCPIGFLLFSLAFLNFKPDFAPAQIFISKSYQAFRYLRSPPLSLLFS